MESFTEGGYPYQFVEEPLDLLICKICQLASRNPYETTCCHNTFCKVCIDLANNQGLTSCPLCRHQPIQINECVQLRRQIMSLHVFCDNKELGCEWVGEVEAIERHKEQCPYYMVNCKYHIVGCDVKLPVHLQAAHNREKAEDHVLMVQQKVEELERTSTTLQHTNEILSITKQELNRSKLELQHTKTKLYHTTDTLNVSQAKLQKTKKQLNETMDQLVVSRKEANDTQRKLADSEDQVNHTIKELLFINENLTVTEKELAIVVSGLIQIKNHVKSNSYGAIKLVALSTQVPGQLRMLPTVFKMPQYAEKKEKKLQWCSDSFYTSNNGYKMCLKVLFGGDDHRGSHISVGLCIMRGPDDNLLAWPLGEKFEITLLNQRLKKYSKIIAYNKSISNKKAGRVKDAEMADTNWCLKFISHSNISADYLIDDCLYFRIQKYRAPRRTCRCISINFCILIFCYYIFVLIGMLMLQ